MICNWTKCHDIISSIFTKELFGEAHILSEIDNADHSGDILKHPICETVLHLKWLLVRKVMREQRIRL